MTQTSPQGKPLLDTVLGHRQATPPIWIMRQAGRYLPEYLKVREEAGSFLDLCYNPKLAAEVTLQPLKRFDLDAAILFSDILVIPDALGQSVRFEKGEGPMLEPIKASDVARLDPQRVVERLAPVLETLSRIKPALAPDKTLIGFCGAPWTVATYMIGGRGSPDQAAARIFALEHPEAFSALMDVLVEASALYLAAQFKSGADMVQIFESWALNLDETAFRTNVIEPNRRLVARLRELIPGAPITGFPRGAAGMLAEYVEKTGVSALGLDYATPLDFASSTFAKTLPLQGNLDPLRLVAGGEQMRTRAREIVSAFADRPHIFNLGHGIVPQTPIDHVADLIATVKGTRD